MMATKRLSTAFASSEMPPSPSAAAWARKRSRDLARAAAADRGDAGDLQQILDEGARGLGILSLQRAQQAGVLAAPAWPLASPSMALLSRPPCAIGPLELANAGGGQRKRIEQRGEQPDVAEPDLRLVQPALGHRLEREGQHFGVRRLAIGAAEGLDAGLRELAALGRRAGGKPGRNTKNSRAVEPPPPASQARATGIVNSGRSAHSRPSASDVTNMRLRISSPERSRKTSAGCSTSGSMRA